MMREILLAFCLLTFVTGYSQKRKQKDQKQEQSVVAIDTTCVRSVYITYKNVPGNEGLFDTLNPLSFLSIVRQSASHLMRMRAESGLSIYGISPVDLDIITGGERDPLKIPGIQICAFSTFTEFWNEELGFVDEGTISDTTYYSVGQISEITVEYLRKPDSLGRFGDFTIGQVVLRRNFPGVSRSVAVFAFDFLTYLRNASGWVIQPVTGFTEPLDGTLASYLSTDKNIYSGIAIGNPVDQFRYSVVAASAYDRARLFDFVPDKSAAKQIPGVKMRVIKSEYPFYDMYGTDSLRWEADGTATIVYPPNDTIYYTINGFTSLCVEQEYDYDPETGRMVFKPVGLVAGITVPQHNRPVEAISISLTNADRVPNQKLEEFILTNYSTEMTQLPWYDQLQKRTFKGYQYLQKSCYETDRY